jgi:hypothetical protein
MQNLKTNINKLLLLSLITLFCGCGCTLGKARCLLPETTRLYATKDLGDPVGKVQTVLVRIPKAGPTIKDDLKCIMVKEYENRNESDKSKLLVIHIQDNNVVIFYEFNLHLNLLIEMQFIPESDNNYVAVVTALLPLTNVMRMIQTPEEKLPVVPVGQDFKMLTKQDFLALMSEITNGNFLKKS